MSTVIKSIEAETTTTVKTTTISREIATDKAETQPKEVQDQKEVDMYSKRYYTLSKHTQSPERVRHRCVEFIESCKYTFFIG